MHHPPTSIHRAKVHNRDNEITELGTNIPAILSTQAFARSLLSLCFLQHVNPAEWIWERRFTSQLFYANKIESAPFFDLLFCGKRDHPFSVSTGIGSPEIMLHRWRKFPWDYFPVTGIFSPGPTTDFKFLFWLLPIAISLLNPIAILASF